MSPSPGSYGRRWTHNRLHCCSSEILDDEEQDLDTRMREMQVNPQVVTVVDVLGID